MQVSNYKVAISKDLQGFVTKVWIYKSVNETEALVLQMVKGQGVAKTYPITKPIPATFEFPLDAETEIVQAFMVAFEKKGITLPEKSHAEGELKATKEHLADMRKLVFKEGN